MTAMMAVAYLGGGPLRLTLETLRLTLGMRKFLKSVLLLVNRKLAL